MSEELRARLILSATTGHRFQICFWLLFCPAIDRDSLARNGVIYMFTSLSLNMENILAKSCVYKRNIFWVGDHPRVLVACNFGHVGYMQSCPAPVGSSHIFEAISLGISVQKCFTCNGKKSSAVNTWVMARLSSALIKGQSLLDQNTALKTLPFREDVLHRSPTRLHNGALTVVQFILPLPKCA